MTADGMVRVPSDQELAQAVLTALTRKVSVSASFTAHDITRAVRQLVGTTVQIDHPRVRAIVHDAMAGPLLGGIYTVDSVDFGVNTALQYSPVGAGAQGAATVAQAPAQGVQGQGLLLPLPGTTSDGN